MIAPSTYLGSITGGLCLPMECSLGTLYQQLTRTDPACLAQSSLLSCRRPLLAEEGSGEA